MNEQDRENGDTDETGDGTDRNDNNDNDDNDDNDGTDVTDSTTPAAAATTTTDGTTTQQFVIRKAVETGRLIDSLSHVRSHHNLQRVFSRLCQYIEGPFPTFAIVEYLTMTCFI